MPLIKPVKPNAFMNPLSLSLSDCAPLPCWGLEYISPRGITARTESKVIAIPSKNRGSKPRKDTIRAPAAPVNVESAVLTENMRVLLRSLVFSARSVVTTGPTDAPTPPPTSPPATPKPPSALATASAAKL